jgi:hypothetical protein
MIRRGSITGSVMADRSDNRASLFVITLWVSRNTDNEHR